MARRTRAAGVWLVLLIAGAVLVVGAVSFLRRAGAAQPIIGVEWVQSSSGPVAMAVDPRGPAGLAGLEGGDLLLAVNGHRVASALDAGELAWEAGAQGSMELRVRRGSSVLTLRVEPEWQPRLEPYTYLAIVGLAFWVSGVFIALRWPAIRGGVIYTLLALCFFTQLTLSHTGRADLLDWSVFWIDLVVGSLTPALLVHLGLSLSKRSVRRRRETLILVYSVSVLLVLLALWLRPEGAGGAYLFAEPLAAVSLREGLEPLWLSVAWMLTIGLLVKSHGRSSSVTHRSQMRWMLWGLGGGLGPFITLYAIPWALGVPELPNWARFLAVAPMLFVPAAFTAALARYRLHDLDLILLRSITEVAALFGTFAVLAAAIFFFREVISQWLPLSRSATRYLGFLVAAVSYPKMRGLVRIGVEKAFYKRRYSYRATLLDWARELSAETDLVPLLGRLRARVRETLDVPEAEVLIRTGAWRFEAVDSSTIIEPLDLDQASLDRLDKEAFMPVAAGALESAPWARYVFSMRVKGRLRAVLAIAEREPREEPLSTEDRALLGTLAAHAATAIEAARLVQEVRQRAAEIERLHARQATILESSAVGLLLLDGEARIRAWNRALEGIYGLPREAALGRRLDEVFPLHVVRRIEREEAGRTEPGETRIFRLGMVNKSGQRVMVNLAISPVDREQEGSAAKVVTFDDVTERVKLEEQLLRQERLAALGLLAAGMAHEINTPLTGISGYAQMLLEELDRDDPRRATLEKIETQTRRASGITASLLNLARPERTSLEALDLNETIHEVLQLFEPQIRGRGIRLGVELADDLPVVPGHKGKLQQVFLNLLINARDAVEPDGEIAVSTFSEDGRVVVEVTDNGAGIAEEDLARIFDPFFTTKGRGKGTGLGLSISYGIVEEHRGEIHVESQPGSFTRFRVELPSVQTMRAYKAGT